MVRKRMFTGYIPVRVREETKEEIKRIIEENPELYDNPSHFSRCAVLRLIKQHKEGDTNE